MTAPRRRTTIGQDPVNYAAVGCTQLDDILRYPPQGFTARFRERKLGSGELRFQTSTEALMSWAVHAGRGEELVDVLLESRQQAPTATNSLASSQEVIYSSTGWPYVSPGVTVTLTSRHQWLRRGKEHGTYRVVSATRGERSSEYCIGTVSDGPVIGEWRYEVQRRDDDTVWFSSVAVTQVNRDKQYRWRTMVIWIDELLRQSRASKSLLATRLA